MAIVSEKLLDGGPENCTFLGNGTLALSLLLKESGIKNKAVAVPVNVCPNVIQAISYSENYPHYIDIEPDNLGMSAVELKKEIDAVSAVIAVHAYGVVCDIKPIAEICKNSGKLLIEDCAQALGAHLEKQPVGSFGDVAVFSFGAGKIVDLKRGGAVISDDALLISRLDSYNSTFPEFSPEQEIMISDFSSLHTFFYNNFYPFRENRYSKLLHNASKMAEEGYRFRVPNDLKVGVDQALGLLDENLLKRKNRAEQFKKIFEGEGIGFHWPKPGSVFWRFNLFISRGRNELLRTLLKEGFKVSSWYPRIDRFMGMQSHRTDFSMADQIGSSILNLWVNEEVNDFYVEEIGCRILEILRHPSG